MCQISNPARRFDVRAMHSNFEACQERDRIETGCLAVPAGVLEHFGQVYSGNVKCDFISGASLKEFNGFLM